MAVAVQMLSLKLFLIARPILVLYAPCRSSVGRDWRPVGVALRRGIERPPFQSRAPLCRGFSRATEGIDLVSSELEEADSIDLVSAELDETGDESESLHEEDYRKFQQVDYGRSRPREAVAPHVAQNYLELTDKELFAQCKMDTFKMSGPGGQHRNKTESAVRLKHIPTGLVAQAGEDRSQHNNRALALGRLRQLIAVEVRASVELEGYKPPPEVVRILPYEKGVKKDRSGQKIGPNHPDFAQGVQGLLDLLETVGGSVSEAAAALGLSTGALSKLITSEKQLWQGANRIRASKGLKPLR